MSELFLSYPCRYGTAADNEDHLMNYVSLKSFVNNLSVSNSF